MTKRYLFFTLLTGAVTVCMAQTLAPVVISSAGGAGASSTAQMSWTIGEPVTATVSTANGTLTQGFEQPWADVVADVPTGPRMMASQYTRTLYATCCMWCIRMDRQPVTRSN